MRRFTLTDRTYLFSYFIFLCILGAVLLYLPFSWNGNGKLKFIDALFTSVSAVCVTGLVTVDTAAFSVFGKWTILLLIQTGGLGYISFSTLYLAIPRRRVSLRHMSLINDYYLDTVEHRPKHIIRNIVITTIVLEIFGSLFLLYGFRGISGDRFFTALFHSVSAFCNAGFSLFSNNLEAYAGNKAITIAIPLLIILGGLGFVVIQDVYHRLRSKTRRLSLHARIVLFSTATLIIFGAMSYFLLEHRSSRNELSLLDRILSAIFQSVTTRTAGFNIINQSELSLPSKVITLPLMFTGGAPGSIAGGVKITTMFVVLYALFGGVEKTGNLKILGHSLDLRTISHAFLFVAKAVLMLFISIVLLILLELPHREDVSVLPVIFEAFSAFGTVGLSLGITSGLSLAGKLVIIGTMFSGRIGLISIAITMPGKLMKQDIEFPRGKILIG